MTESSVMKSEVVKDDSRSLGTGNGLTRTTEVMEG